MGPSTTIIKDLIVLLSFGIGNLVDADYNFIYLDFGCNVRVSDGGVYANSSLMQAIDKNLLNLPDPSCLSNTTVKTP